MIEEWRDIEGYEYQISNYGIVRSKDRVITRNDGSTYLLCSKVKQPYMTRRGYYMVRLHRDGSSGNFLVHRLVAMAFPEICGEWFEGCQINHKDECKTNNIATNLETCTSKYNMNYGYGAVKRQQSLSRYSKPVVAIKNNGFYKIYQSAKDASRELGMCSSAICNNIRGRSKYCLGYQFMYAEDYNNIYKNSSVR